MRRASILAALAAVAVLSSNPSVGRAQSLAPTIPDSVDVVAAVLTLESDLALDSAQTVAFAALRDSLGHRRDSLRVAADSLRAVVRMPGDGRLAISDADREVIRQARRELATVVADLRDEERTRRERALALLTADQRRRLAWLLAPPRST